MSIAVDYKVTRRRPGSGILAGIDFHPATGYRLVPPAETLARVTPYLRRFGITRIANVTGLDFIGISTVMVTRPNGRSMSVTQGKGIDLDAAKASGVMEALELWAAEHAQLPQTPATAQDLRRHGRVADVRRLPVYQRPHRDSERILWTPGRALGSGESVQVPHELVHFDLTVPRPRGSGHFLVTTSGLASGNDQMEAISHGVCELIERDATTLFLALPAERQWKRRLDLDSVDDPICAELLELYRAARVDVAVWDTTTDVGVASFLCDILDGDRNPFRPIGLARGAGCHPDRRVALSRALCEAAQSRLTRIAGTRDDIFQDEVAALQSARRMEAHRREREMPGQPPRSFSEVANRVGHGREEDLAWLRDQLASVGMDEVLTVDLTPADVPFNVVRTIIPGLEALSELPGYHPGERALAGEGRRV